MGKKKIREWVNTITAILVLIVMIIGLFQIISLNINLEKINSKEVTTNKINILNPDGSLSSVIEMEEDGTLKIKGKDNSTLTLG